MAASDASARPQVRHLEFFSGIGGMRLGVATHADITEVTAFEVRRQQPLRCTHDVGTTCS